MSERPYRFAIFTNPSGPGFVVAALHPDEPDPPEDYTPPLDSEYGLTWEDAVAVVLDLAAELKLRGCAVAGLGAAAIVLQEVPS